MGSHDQSLSSMQLGLAVLIFFVSLLQPFWILHEQHKHDGGGHEKSTGQWHLWIISARGEGRLSPV